MNTEEKKEMELVALPKDFIMSKIEALVAANKDIFKEYDMLVTALNHPVNIVQKEETKEE